MSCGLSPLMWDGAGCPAASTVAPAAHAAKAAPRRRCLCCQVSGILCFVFKAMLAGLSMAGSTDEHAESAASRALRLRSLSAQVNSASGGICIQLGWLTYSRWLRYMVAGLLSWTPCGLLCRITLLYTVTWFPGASSGWHFGPLAVFQRVIPVQCRCTAGDRASCS